MYRYYTFQPSGDLSFCMLEPGQNQKKKKKKKKDLEIACECHKTIGFLALPIYTHIANLEGLAHIIFE